jgi:hypothetical protein
VNDRPSGIVVLGIISFLAGIVLIFIGLTLTGVVIFGAVPGGNGSFIAGILTIAVGALYVAVAIGAWFTRPWARLAGIVTAAFGLTAGVITLVLTGAIGHAIATFVFPIFLLWYLNRASVKAAFVDEV